MTCRHTFAVFLPAAAKPFLLSTADSSSVRGRAYLCSNTGERHIVGKFSLRSSGNEPIAELYEG